MQKKSAAGKKSKGRLHPLVTLFAVLLFLAGAAVLLYPTISNWLAEIHQSSVIQAYEEELAGEDEAFYAAEWEKARTYNDNLAGDPVHDPFLPGSGYALPENYMDCLNINGVMGYIEIPKIGVRLPIYHGTSEKVLQEGVGHIESTALPIGGDFTHAILTGHRGLPSAKLFTDLDQLTVGDTFVLRVLDETLTYEVDQIHIVEPEDVSLLEIEDGQDLCTLVTCTPYGINSHRLLVRGHRIENQADASAVRVTADAMQIEPVLVAPVVAAPMLLVLLLWLLASGPKKHRKHKTRKE